MLCQGSKCIKKPNHINVSVYALILYLQGTGLPETRKALAVQVSNPTRLVLKTPATADATLKFPTVIIKNYKFLPDGSRSNFISLPSAPYLFECQLMILSKHGQHLTPTNLVDTANTSIRKASDIQLLQARVPLRLARSCKQIDRIFD